MASAAPVPMQHAVRFCVKNTFIDEIDTGADEEQSSFLPRIRTEPAPRSGPGDSEEPSGADSDGDGSPGRAETAAPASLGAMAALAQANDRVSFCVKNTFVVVCDDEDERAEEEQLLFPPRGRTEPVARLGSLDSADDSSEQSCGISRSDLGGDQGGADCSSEGHRALPAHAPVAAATPTPWPDAREAQQLRFSPEPVPTQAQPPDASADPSVAPRLAPQPALAAPSALAGISVSARDLSLVVSQTGGACRVQWSVDAKKLRGSDKQVVSPPLEVSLGPGVPPATFKLMLYPRGGRRGGDSFKTAGGVGQVQLKCCSDLPEGSWPLTAISVSVGSGAKAQAPRGPFVHGFGSSLVFGAPREQADWDFGASAAASVVAVAVEVAPCA